MSLINNSLLLGADAAAGGYQIQRSLRFNSADSAYLSRTFGTPTTQGTFTWAGWVKLAALGTTRHLFGVSTNHSFGFTSGDALNLTFGGTSALTTTALFRDPSAWYHIVWKQSGTSHTIYVNNVSVGTATATSSVFNTAVAHQLGAANTANYFNGYLADIHFIDGQALDPTSFGEFDADGIWQPKAYSGSYGTNGFKLDFADNASTTTIGYDAAGSNDWTATNLSVTAGSGNDSLVDSPTNYGTDTGAGGEVRGNYCTLNPLSNNLTTQADIQNGALEIVPAASYGASITQGANCTIGVSSGKWYFEGSPVLFAGTGNQSSFGWTQSVSPAGTFYANTKTSSIGVLCDNFGGVSNFKTNGVSASLANDTSLALGAASGDVFQIAIDFDAAKIWIGRNGTWYNSGNPAAGTNATSTFTNSGANWVPWIENASYIGNRNKTVANFGQRPFAYTAPSGFKALCTANLPTPTITKGSSVMDVVTYTGTGATLTPTSTLGFSPDLVWIKGRSGATDHAIYDAVRGTTKQLESNTTTDETTESTGLTAFNSNGFTVGALAQVNTSTATYAAWCWDESVSAGFDIVTYTGNGSARTIAHSLGVAPSLIIVKARTTAGTDQGWPVYHAANTSDPKTDYLLLNSGAATADLDTVWNDTAPTSSVFSVGTNALVNANSDTYLAYLWAPVSGYSAFGSYTGNGSADGPFVYLGFRPRWVMVKISSGDTANWVIYDSSRGDFNLNSKKLAANLSVSENDGSNLGDDTVGLDFLSNGFKIRTTGANHNTNAATYVYAAFAENPFSLARAR
jgi:hypothetical protein